MMVRNRAALWFPVNKYVVKTSPLHSIIIHQLLIMKKILLILIIAASYFLGCKKSENDAQSKSQFQGKWKGTYAGGDKGGLSVDVDANGNLKGTSVSSNTLEAFGMTGNVDSNGSFSGTTEIGTTFTGKFTTALVNGTWSNTSLKFSGTWVGTKQ